MRGLLFDSWQFLFSQDQKALEDILLEERGIITEEEKQQFFHQEYPNGLHEPSLLKDYQKALDRVLQAIANKEKIIVFGDYDVDGVVGTSILTEVLQKVGALVSYRIPHRKKHGYGLKSHFLDELYERGVTLIITVDNGIAAAQAIAHAKSLGIDVIVTDHHIPQAEIPPAFAIVNPKQEGCPYPYKELCGAALAYKLALGIAQHFFSPKEFEAYKHHKLDLVALATVADCMPLTGENRVIVKEGLQVLKSTKNPGLQALIESAGISLEKPNADIFGFQIGPRINAAGRLSEAYIALQMLLGKTEFAQELESLNAQRKAMVKEALEQANNDIAPNALIMKSSPDWHAGIIGLIAGQLTEKHFLPSIILEEQEHQLVASCRAPEGFDIFAFLLEFKDFFDHFGGHEQAAGFSIAKHRFDEFRILAEAQAKKLITLKPLHKKLPIHAELSLEDLHLDLFHTLQQFEPFGMGNEKPSFILKNVAVEWRTMGKENDHLLGVLRKKNGEEVRILKFFAGHLVDVLRSHKIFHVVGSLSKNTWEGRDSLQIDMVDIAF